MRAGACRGGGQDVPPAPDMPQANQHQRRITAMKTSGYDGKILAGPYNFNLVTTGSYESIQAALNDLGNIRENVIFTAWLYIE